MNRMKLIAICRQDSQCSDKRGKRSTMHSCMPCHCRIEKLDNWEIMRGWVESSLDAQRTLVWYKFLSWMQLADPPFYSLLQTLSSPLLVVSR